jgi:hypothetical protein
MNGAQKLLLGRINFAQSPTKVALTGNSFLVGNADSSSLRRRSVVRQEALFWPSCRRQDVLTSGTA